jgi:hypothetical protein
MKEELELELVKKYPEFFTDYKGNPMETCMAWGCEHSDGWFYLLSDLCHYIQCILKHQFRVKVKEGYKGDDVDEYDHITLPKPSFRFMQIKEKFGTLRIYHSMVYDAEEFLEKIDMDDFNNEFDTNYQIPIREAIEYVEFLSAKTCEDCGKRGKTYFDGWWRTLCPDCAKAQDRSDHVDIKDAP